MRFSFNQGRFIFIGRAGPFNEDLLHVIIVPIPIPIEQCLPRQFLMRLLDEVLSFMIDQEVFKIDIRISITPEQLAFTQHEIKKWNSF